MFAAEQNGSKEVFNLKLLQNKKSRKPR